MKKANFFET